MVIGTVRTSGQMLGLAFKRIWPTILVIDNQSQKSLGMNSESMTDVFDKLKDINLQLLK